MRFDRVRAQKNCQPVSSVAVTDKTVFLNKQLQRGQIKVRILMTPTEDDYVDDVL